jgi:hypothetical protein
LDDLSTDQTLRTAFTALRTAEREQISPPGADAARRTVRHRRRVGAAAAAAGLTTLVAVGAGYFAGAGPHAPTGGDGAGPGTATTVNLTVPGPSHDAPAGPDEPAAAGSLTIRTEDSAVGLPEAGDPTAPVEFAVKGPGTYVLRVACSDPGGGSVTLTARIRDEEVAVTARCTKELTIDEGAGWAETILPVADPGQLRVSLAEAADEAATADGRRPNVVMELSRR